ncbi:MAG: trypsin-like peptidase domain-containing protein, partial [Oscillibacter sp.]|nr:trypsin-like peptidase domain-containing protein [Oscillibacter sp.]
YALLARHRAHAAVLLVRLSGVRPSAVSTTLRDVPDWAKPEITYAVSRGWINGTSGSTFSPNEPVSANAWCALLLRLLGYSERNADFGTTDAALFARRIGLISRDLPETLTRGDVFETMKDALSFPYRGRTETVLEHLIAAGVCDRTTASAIGLLEPALTARQVADRYMSAVFCMTLYFTQSALEEDDVDAHASGFFISPDGIAVTNYHSIQGSVAARATLATGEVCPVERVLWFDRKIDLAIIRVSRQPLSGSPITEFRTLDVVGTKEIRAGDVVYALSNPLGYGLQISSGVIGSTAHDIDRYALPCIVNSADISQGSSGGALMNVYGQVIGVTAGAYTRGNNLYLAVPADPIFTAERNAEGWTLAEVMELEDKAD